MSDVTIPEDVKQLADGTWNWLVRAEGREAETEIIARAILAERERAAKVADHHA